MLTTFRTLGDYGIIQDIFRDKQACILMVQGWDRLQSDCERRVRVFIARVKSRAHRKLIVETPLVFHNKRTRSHVQRFMCSTFLDGDETAFTGSFFAFESHWIGIGNALKSNPSNFSRL